MSSLNRYWYILDGKVHYHSDDGVAAMLVCTAEKEVQPETALRSVWDSHTESWVIGPNQVIIE